MRRFLPLFVLPIVLAACAVGEGGSEQAHLIAVLPYTGGFEVKAARHENAIRMALDDLVEAGAHNRMERTFNVVPVNAGDGKDVVASLVEDVMQQLGDNVLGIISSTGEGHEGSVEAAIQYGIPHMETSSGAHDDEFLDWEQYSDDELSYLMSSRALCNYEAIVTAEFIMERWPTGRVALFRGDKTHDKMHTGTIRSTLEAMGFQGVVIESNDPAIAGDDTYAGNDQDFLLSYEALESGGVEADIRAVLDAHQPDVVFWHLRGDAANMRFVQDAERAGYGDHLLTCGMARNDTFIDPNENGLISDYLVGNDALLDDERFFFVMRSPLPSAELDQFYVDFEERYDDVPDTFTPSVYDAAMLWGLGVIGAEAFNGEAVRNSIVATSREGDPLTRAELGRGIQSLSQGEDMDYVGASSPMDMRDDRTVPGSYYIERVVPSGSGYAYEELASPPRVTK
jgi:hypothetical protein